MDLMHDHGIGVVLATPTASPPPWMGRLHPETLPRDEDGRHRVVGRPPALLRHSSAVYRQHAAAHHRGPGRPLRATTRRSRCGTSTTSTAPYDYGDEAAARFRDWLRDRYGTLDALNDGLGHRLLEPALRRLGRDRCRRGRAHVHEEPHPGARLPPLHLRRAAGVLHRRARHRPPRTPRDIPVTTNFMPLWAGQDGWRWAEEEDVVSVDLYPDPHDPLGAQHGALVQRPDPLPGRAAPGC